MKSERTSIKMKWASNSTSKHHSSILWVCYHHPRSSLLFASFLSLSFFVSFSQSPKQLILSHEMNVFIGNSISFLCPFWVCGIFGFPSRDNEVFPFFFEATHLKIASVCVCVNKWFAPIFLFSISISARNLISQFKDIVSKLFQYSLNRTQFDREKLALVMVDTKPSMSCKSLL